MELASVIRSRRSIRKYREEPIPPEELEWLLEAALWAPSAVNLQPWYFVVLQSKAAMDRLAQVMEEVARRITPELQEQFRRHPGVVEESTRFIRSLGGAPVCILAFQYKPTYSKSESTIIQSVAAAIENLLLAAEDRGIGACWLTAPLEARLGDALQQLFAPDKGPLAAVITLGYPASSTPPAPPARKSGRYVIL